MPIKRSTLSIALLVCSLATAEAQTAVPPEQRQLMNVVVNSPALAAAYRRTTAARERVGASGRLADVEVEGMGSRMNGPMDERSTMWELNVRQPLPKRGARAADRERARAGVFIAEADYALIAGEMAADTATALAEAAGAEARIRLLETQVGRHQTVLRSLESRIATQRGIIDRLNTMFERATTIDDLITLETTIAQHQATLEDLEAQQRSVSDQVALSTISLYLRSEAEASNAVQTSLVICVIRSLSFLRFLDLGASC